MIEYVVGFAFDRKLQRVVLIHKLRGPDAVVNKWNGVGGKVESAAMETDSAAMCREFAEEAGVLLHPSEWTRFCVLIGDVWAVSFFRTVIDNAVFDRIESQTDERVDMFFISAMPSNIVPNLRWLIPMALDYDIRTARVFEYGTSTLLAL